MSCPPFKGGQGRTTADLRKSASGMVWTTLAALAFLLACCGANV